MQAQEAVGEFAFEMGQRLVEQIFALARARRHVLEIGLEIQDFGDRHEQQAAAFLAGKMAAAAAAHGLADQGEIFAVRWRGRRAHLLQRREQALGAYRLEQVIDGVEVEGLHGVIVEGGREDHGGRAGQAAEMAGEFDAVHARHADVGEHDIDRLAFEEFEGRHAVGGFARDDVGQVAGDVAEQGAQALAGQRLVIDEQDFQRVFCRHGRKMQTS